MDVVNQLIEQARNLFASMTPSARLTAGLLLAVVVVSVGFLFRQSTSGPDAYLFGSVTLNANEIVAIEAAIGKAGLGDYEIQGNRIRVPRAMKNLYVAAVADAGAVPRSAQDHMAKALDGGSVFDSREVKNARLKDAIKRQLAEIITDMPWVAEATVLYGEEKMPGLGARNRASATVAVQPLPGEMLDPRRVRNLQRLVAGHSPSLTPDKVTVIDQSDNSTYGLGGVDPSEFNDPYHQTLVAYENRLRNNILQHLNYIPGVRVQVSAKLDTRVNAQVRSTKTEKDPLVRRTSEQNETTTENTTDGAGRPGVEANGPLANNAEGPTRTNQSQTTNRREEAASVFPDTKTIEQIAGLQPEEVQASVEVPRDYIVEVWRKRQIRQVGKAPDKVDATELQIVEDEVVRDLNNAVEPLLPDPPGAQDEYKTVHVVVFDRVDAAPLPSPSVASEAMWFASKHASTAAMVAISIFGLMMLRSVVSGTPKGGDGVIPSLQLHTPDGELVPPSDTESEEDGGRPKLQLKKPDSLKDDLANIVRDDPDAAAAILRGWIGSAG